MDLTTLMYTLFFTQNTSNGDNAMNTYKMIFLYIIMMNMHHIFAFIKKYWYKYTIKNNIDYVYIHYIRYIGKKGTIINSELSTCMWYKIINKCVDNTYTIDANGIIIPELYKEFYVEDDIYAIISESQVRNEIDNYSDRPNNNTNNMFGEYFTTNFKEQTNNMEAKYIEYKISLYRKDNDIKKLNNSLDIIFNNYFDKLSYYIGKDLFCISLKNTKGTTTSMCDTYNDTYEFTHKKSKMGANISGCSKFNFSKLKTTKVFDNVFVDNKLELTDRIDHFMNNEQYYNNYGIPYKLAILMYGVPGCGKTSTIKAIAKYTNRHIFNIDMATIHTKDAMKDIFSDGFVKYNGLPISNSKLIYVFEDIDISLDCIKKKTDINKENYNNNYKNNEFGIDIPFEKIGMVKMAKMIEEDTGNKLDIGSILNIFDGIVELSNIMIIITTNEIENLNDALIRPGRMDLKLEFKKASCDIIKQMIKHYFDIDMNIDNKFAYQFTSAEIMEMCVSKSKLGDNSWCNNDDGFICEQITKALEKLLYKTELTQIEQMEQLMQFTQLENNNNSIISFTT